MSSLDPKKFTFYITIENDVSEKDLNNVIMQKGSCDIFTPAREANTHQVINLSQLDKLSDLSKIIYSLPPSHYELSFVFIGGLINDRGMVIARLVLDLFNFIGHKEVRFEYVSLHDQYIDIYPIVFKYRTLHVSTNPEYSKPEDAVDTFHYQYIEKIEDILDIDKLAGVNFGNNKDKTFQITTITNLVLVSNGLDWKEMAIITRLSEIYPHIEHRTQTIPGPILFGLLTRSEHVAIRNAAPDFTLVNFHNITEITQLEAKGYVKIEQHDPVDLDDDPITTYKLTEKGERYKMLTEARVSLTNGIAVDDIITNLRSGMIYKVMDFDYISGEFKLMAMDYSAASLDINNNTDFFQANREEIAKFNKVVQ